VPAIPDPALVVLIGASASGKTHWVRARYRAVEIVSSDGLRAVVGSGEHDLDASRDAFALLDTIVAARLGRRLTTVVDTLGTDPEMRTRWLATARAAGISAVAVVFTTDLTTCRRRNAARDVPVPAPALRAQQARVAAAHTALADEGWDLVVEIDASDTSAAPAPAPSPAPEPDRPALRFVLQVGRFPWGVDPAGWLIDVAQSAERSGFHGLALMDHLIQIPQVDRAWEPIPEPYVTLGLLAGHTDRLALGTLVSPVTWRPAGVLAKAVATLDALSSGRAFLGLGAGWWAREHAGFGVPLPPVPDRMDALATAAETVRALWAPGTKAYHGELVDLPETTCYPRPVGRIPLLIGGGGERRTLRIAARWADACNVRSDEDVLARKIAALRRHCAELGRDPGEVEITVLDLPVIGDDRDDTARRVERLRGRTSAADFAARHSAAPAPAQIERYRRLADLGVGTVFLSLPDLAGAQDVARLAAIPAAFAIR
jgi:alkanesulfonate monooxygenase SsuD/methylene tetrahydromethanopterin reductase-like flavin-dependent oxidoreductase (luciferase family)/predicted kinase